MNRTHSLAPFAVSLCLLTSGARAAEYLIAMTSSNTFDPKYLVVHVGDTVTWTNEDDGSLHDSYDTNWWWSGYLNTGETFSITPSFTGTYPYVDSTWGPFGMTGTIVVVPALPPPLILFTPAILPNGSFQCIVSNLALGKTIFVQASSNFVNWINISTNVASDYSFPFVDVNASPFSRRFYRVVALP